MDTVVLMKRSASVLWKQVKLLFLQVGPNMIAVALAVAVAVAVTVPVADAVAVAVAVAVAAAVLCLFQYHICRPPMMFEGYRKNVFCFACRLGIPIKFYQPHIFLFTVNSAESGDHSCMDLLPKTTLDS